MSCWYIARRTDWEGARKEGGGSYRILDQGISDLTMGMMSLAPTLRLCFNANNVLVLQMEKNFDRVLSALALKEEDNKSGKAGRAFFEVVRCVEDADAQLRCSLP